MAHPLDGARQKVGRARQHLKLLDRRMGGWIKRHPYGLGFEQDPETGHYVVRVRFRRRPRPIPVSWGLLVGDAVHNLRSALDHLIWQLATTLGTGPGTKTQFPVFEDAEDYGRKHKSLLGGVPERYWARIEALQPYHVRAAIKAERTADDILAAGLGVNLLLFILARLDNADKHRILLPRTALSLFREPTFTNVGRAKGQYPAQWIRMDEGAEVFRITEIEIIDPALPMQVKADTPFTIVFGDPASDQETLWNDRTKGAANSSDLRAAADAIERIIESFTPDFPA